MRPLSADDLRARRALFVGASALVVFGAVELAAGLVVGWRPLAVRLGWAVLALAAALLLARSRRAGDWALWMLGLASPLLLTALLRSRGPVDGLGEACLLATPLLFALLFPGRTPVVVLTGVGTLVAGSALAADAAGQAWSLSQWALACMSAAGLAVYASALQRDASRAVAQSLRDRAQAQIDHAAANQARADAERASLLAQLAAGLAHEVNNPLAVVHSNLQMLEARLAGSSVLAEELEAVAESREATRRIVDVIRRIKELAPVDVRGGDETDAAALLRARAQAFARAQGVLLVDQLPLTCPPVRCAPGQLEQVFQQALAIARDAFNRSGASPVPTLWLRGYEEGEFLTLSVEDNANLQRGGDGVRPLRESKIAARGADGGVGVLLAHELLRQWGGEVFVQTPAQGGERVVFRLRRAVPGPGSSAT